MRASFLQCERSFTTGTGCSDHNDSNYRYLFYFVWTCFQSLMYSWWSIHLKCKLLILLLSWSWRKLHSIDGEIKPQKAHLDRQLDIRESWASKLQRIRKINGLLIASNGQYYEKIHRERKVISSWTKFTYFDGATRGAVNAPIQKNAKN